MPSQEPTAPAPTEQVKQEEPAPAVDNATAPVPSTEDGAGTSPPIALVRKDYDVMTSVLLGLTNYRDQDGREVSKDFQRIVSRRILPDYYDVIKEPTAFSTIRSKISKKQYTAFKEFVRDFALICHNAQVYNRPSAIVYGDAVTLRGLFKIELQNLVADGVIPAEDAEFPDLGDIPEVEDSPPPGPGEEEEAEEEEDEDEEDEEEDETDDDRLRRRKKNRRSSAAGKRDGKGDDVGKEDPDAQKKRGRPPKVHTPMEARINALLKGMRKFKNTAGDLKILPFEKLPDKAVLPDYYQEIKNPIAMDLIKRNAKRKKYHSVDMVLKDLQLMFANAMLYNQDDSQVYKDAVDLLHEAGILAEQEKKKPDSDFVDEDGRLPLPEILYNNEIWKVGDWIHLLNPNDVTKPIVAQIYRTWQDTQGQKWINACWYYRPEQTVHRFEKHFYEHEVVKTGQYRDHKVEEIVDRCFVMFFTRYFRGRPEGFPEDKEIYVCEARYNEEKFKLNKIKTWASCIPDEVRDPKHDYVMTLYSEMKSQKKVPSPIKHLLRPGAKEDDPLPKPTWGAPNAPPIVGAVHKRPREANESPPPEPTPSPPPPEPEPARRPVTSDRPRYDSQGDISMSGTVPLPSPAAHNSSSHTPYGQQFASVRPSASPAPLTQQTSYGSHGSHSAVPQTPQYPSQNSYGQYAAATPSAHHQAPHSNYNQYQNSTPVRPVAQTSSSHMGHSGNAYNPPRAIEVYTLADVANNSIPADIRSQFHHDENGRTLFFTAPPLDVKPLVGDQQVLGHSLRYLADKARAKEEDEKKRRARDADLEVLATEKLKRMKMDEESMTSWIVEQKKKALLDWSAEMDKGTDELYQQLYGEEWKAQRELALARLAVAQEEAFKDKKRLEAFDKSREDTKEIQITGFRF